MRARGEQLVDLREELRSSTSAAPAGRLEELVRLVERDELDRAELDRPGAQDGDERIGVDTSTSWRLAPTARPAPRPRALVNRQMRTRRPALSRVASRAICAASSRVGASSSARTPAPRPRPPPSRAPG